MNSLVSLCVLEALPSLQEFLLENKNLSESKIKKMARELKLSRKFLQQSIVKGRSLELPLSLINHGMIHPVYRGKEVRILTETEYWLAVDKPDICHSHPLDYSDDLNILSFLRAKGKREALLVNRENYDRGLLYRLDFETSGVLLLAKNQSLYDKVRENFHQIPRKKIYLAIVQGDFQRDGLILNQLSQSGKVIKESERGKQAKLTSYKLSYNEKHDLSLLGIELDTGLRHQIRLQLSLAGHPILGDVLYGGKEARRMFLHAYYYQFDLDEFRLEACSAEPELFGEIFTDLDRCLDMLRNKFEV
jgi:23S rRNA pseudouridine1911/1915/1917 synthase